MMFFSHHPSWYGCVAASVLLATVACCVCVPLYQYPLHEETSTGARRRAQDDLSHVTKPSIQSGIKILLQL